MEVELISFCTILMPMHVFSNLKAHLRNCSNPLFRKSFVVWYLHPTRPIAMLSLKSVTSAREGQWQGDRSLANNLAFVNKQAHNEFRNELLNLYTSHLLLLSGEKKKPQDAKKLRWAVPPPQVFLLGALGNGQPAVMATGTPVLLHSVPSGARFPLNFVSITAHERAL